MVDMIAPSDIKIDVRDLTVYYGQDAVIENLSLTVMRNEILGIIGPANSGKSTFLRVLNRTLELTANTRATGRVLLDGEDTLSSRDASLVRQRIGIVFALPMPLPLTIYENVAYGPKRLKTVPKSELPDVVEHSLTASHLWDEVKDRLDEPAGSISACASRGR